jgi:hypothetical protein
MTEVDKLLICLAIILLLTIIWTILIGIMYSFNGNKTTRKKKILLDDDYDDLDEDEFDNILETYVQVRFYRTKKDLIYVAPKNVVLRKGDKLKVLTDEGDIRTCRVVKGNYTREKYKNYEYQTLNIVK